MTTQQRTTAVPEVKATFPVTPRAVLIGAASVGLLAAVNPFLAFVSRTWSVGSGSLMGSPLVMLFLLLLGNTLVARLRPGRALQRGELVVVYGMLIVAVGLAMQGGIPYIVSATAYPIYMATPENQWQHVMWPYIPTWLRPTTMEASIWFWEGLPEKTPFPWAAWSRPMFAWGGFTFALMAAVFCLGSLLSKDWIERQRLSFPLVDIPLAMTGEEPRPTLASSILRNRIFWLGFALPSLLAVLGWLHALFPSVPSVSLWDMQIGRNFAGMGLPWNVLGEMKVSILFTVIGVTCLLPAEVSLSLWLFYVLFLLQLLLWASFGVAEGGQSSVAINPRSFIGFEEAGGFIALSAATLYQSRHTIRAAALQLVGRARPEDDPSVPLAGRAALLGFILANGFMFWFAAKAEMQWWAFAALMGMFYAVLIGASRLVAAGGVMYVDTGFFPRGIVLRTFGATSLTPATNTLFAYLSVIYMYDPMNLAMPQVMNSLKLVHSGRVRAKAFSWAAGIAVAAILAVGLPAILMTVSRPGATALERWPFTSYPGWAFGELAATFRTPEMADNFLRLALVLGAGIVFLLVWLNSRFVWWPLSPVGFVIASAYETNRSIWASAFIGWLIATVVRHYGGLRLYRSFRPVFIGLVLGQFLTDGALAIVSSVFGIKMPAG